MLCTASLWSAPLRTSLSLFSTPNLHCVRLHCQASTRFETPAQETQVCATNPVINAEVRPQQSILWKMDWKQLLKLHRCHLFCIHISE